MTESFSFANNFWGKDETGVQNLLQRMHNAKQTCEEVHSFFKERIAIEEDYSRRMIALGRKSLGASDSGTLKEALDVIRNTTESMGKSHGTAAIQIKQQLDDPLEAFAASLRQRRKTTESMIEKLHKAKLSQNTAVEKARTKFEQDCNKINGYYAQQNLLLGKELEKNNIKLEKTHMSIDNTRRDYQNSLRVLAETIDRWNKEWKLACDKFQDLEEERINFLKSNLWAYTNIVSTVCVSDDEGCETIRIGLEKCDVDQDIVEFVKAKGTGSEILDPPEFINFLDGYSRDTMPNAFKVANFSRGDEQDGIAEDNEGDTETLNLQRQHDKNYSQPLTESSYDQQKTARIHEPLSSAMSRTSTLDNRDSLSAFSVPMLSYQSESERSGQSSPVHELTSPNSSVYSNNTSISSRSEFSTSESEEIRPPMEKKRSWASPFRRKSKKDLSKGWNSFSRNDSTTSSGPIASPNTSNTDFNIDQESTITAKSGLGKQFVEQKNQVKSHSSSRPASVLSMGENMFDLGVSPSKSSSSPFENKRSLSPKKQLSKDDPLVAALERLKVSSVAPTKSNENVMTSSASSPGISSLAAPEPAFTAAEMEATQNRYGSQTREMFDFRGDNRPQSRQQPNRAMQRPRSTIDLAMPRSPSPSPQHYGTAKQRPKSAYFGEPDQSLDFNPYNQQQRQQQPQQQQQQQRPYHQRSKSASPTKQQFSGYQRSASPRPYEGQEYQQDDYNYQQGYDDLQEARNQVSGMTQDPSYQRQQRPRSSMQQYEQESGMRSHAMQGYSDQQMRPRSKSTVDERPRLRPNHSGLPRTAQDGRPIIKYCKAAYDYRAAIPEEVSFRKGDILLVLRMQEDGWWEVEVMGNRNAVTGLAPSNFLVNA